MNKNSIRIYPKNETINPFDSIRISKSLLSNLRYLQNQLQYRIDDMDNYLEILFNGELYQIDNLSSALDLDLANYNIWKLGGNAYYECDCISKIEKNKDEVSEKAIYQFDRMEFTGNQNKLISFYEDIFDSKSLAKIITQINNSTNKIIIDIEGEYIASNESDVGLSYSEDGIKVHEFELVNQLQFIGIGNSYIQRFETRENTLMLKKLFLDKLNYMGSTEAKTIELNQITFYFRNRKIRSYQWNDNNPKSTDKYRYGEWITKSSDWWDNCINKKWIEFNQKKK